MKKNLSRNVEESVIKLLDPDPEAETDDVQNFISYSVCTDRVTNAGNCTITLAEVMIHVRRLNSSASDQYRRFIVAFWYQK